MPFRSTQLNSIAIAVLLVSTSVMIGGCRDGKTDKPGSTANGNASPPSTSNGEAAHKPEPEFKGKIRVGHLVGICMSPLFMADAKDFFKDEGLDVELTFMPNPGDSVSALAGGSVQFIHNPFTNTYVAASNGAKLKIIAGSGNGGLVCIAQRESGLQTLADLKGKAGSGLRIGSERINTLELAMYRTLKNQDLDYKDFEMVWFTDHFAMLSAFQTKNIDVVTHVEPYATQLIQQTGGIALATSFDVWGEGAPDCVVSVTEEFLKKHPETVRRYIRAIYRADQFIKADMAQAVEILDAGKYYRVDKKTLVDAIPRQPPGVDLRKGVKGMETAINDMFELKYLKSKPESLVDLTILEKVVSESEPAQKEDATK